MQEHPDDVAGQVGRDNLTARVYEELREALMEGRFQPGHRFKIRELAAFMGVSETPIREALMQLVRERALTMRTGRSLEVARLTADQYDELRTVRQILEGLAGEKATPLVTAGTISTLEELNERLFAAEREERFQDAVRLNWIFHRTLYREAAMPELVAIIETIWLRNGPVINVAYPCAPPTYAKRHQHLALLEGLHERDPVKVREAICADIAEGGASLSGHLRRLETGRNLQGV